MSKSKRNHPPRYGEKILRKFLPESEKQSLMGDYEEIYKDLSRNRGRFSANLWYVSQIILTFLSAVKNSIVWSAVMFKNYLKIALRNIRKHKGYSFINIVGLAVGLACFILISLWVKHEMTYDQFHVKKDRIFRILNALDTGNFAASVTYALGPELEANYSDIEASCRVWPWHRSLVQYGDIRFDEHRFYLADPSFFDVFTFTFIQGIAETALSDLHSIVITEATAQRYFGEEDPIGKTLYIAQPDADFQVTGVIANIPSNSHLQFDLITRVEHLGEDRIRRWEEWVASSYVLLRGGAERENVEEKIEGIYEGHLSYEPDYWPVLQPLHKVHLYEYGRPGLIRQVAIVSIIALFILIIACINFMNLSTARSIKRAKEVGLRKVTGARRSQLIKQFLGESFVLSYLSLVLAVIIVQIVVPVFNRFTGLQLSLMDQVVIRRYIYPLSILLKF